MWNALLDTSHKVLLRRPLFPNEATSRESDIASSIGDTSTNPQYLPTPQLSAVESRPPRWTHQLVRSESLPDLWLPLSSQPGGGETTEAARRRRRGESRLPYPPKTLRKGHSPPVLSMRRERTSTQDRVATSATPASTVKYCWTTGKPTAKTQLHLVHPPSKLC